MAVHKVKRAIDKYQRLFTEQKKVADWLFYYDEKMPSMYSHHYYHIDNHDLSFLNWLEGQKEENGFLHIVFPVSFHVEMWYRHQLFMRGFTWQTYLVMMARTDQFQEVVLPSNVRIIRAETLKEIDECLEAMIDYDGAHVSPKFAVDKVNRKREVYERGDIVLYGIEKNGRMIGACEWMVDKDIVRIEDFSIVDEEQRKGYGSLLVKQMMIDAYKRGVKQMFLTTYEDETAQQMYRKLGFTTLTEIQSAFWIGEKEILSS